MTYGEIIELLKQICAQHKHIKKVYTVDSTRLEGAELSEIEYPAVFIENPDINPGTDGTTSFNIELAVLQNANRGHFETEEFALDYTSGIAQDIFHKMLGFRDLLGLQVNSATMQPISTFTGDNDFGWRLVFNIKDTTTSCREENYDEEYPFGFLNKLQFDTVGNTTTITNLSTPWITPDSVQFSYMLDDDTPVVSSSIPSSIPTNTKMVSIKSTILINGYYFYAYCNFDSSIERSNFSSPINPIL